MKTPNLEKLPVPAVKQDWYELRMYFLGKIEPEKAFFKAGCNTEALNEAKKRAKARSAFHFDVSPITIKEQMESSPS